MSCIIGITSTYFSCVASEGRIMSDGEIKDDKFNKTFEILDKKKRKYIGAHCGSTVWFSNEKISKSIENIFINIDNDKFEDVICSFIKIFEDRICQAKEKVSDRKIDLIIIGPNREMFKAIFKAESETNVILTECQIITPISNHFCCYGEKDEQNDIQSPVMEFLSHHNIFNEQIAHDAITIAIEKSKKACGGDIFVLSL